MTLRIFLFVFLALLITAPTSAFAEGDPVRGTKVFKKCKACHSVKAGKHKIGPSLFNIWGRKAGGAEGFKRYKGLKGAKWSWDAASLDGYLTDPKKFVKTRTNRRSAMVLKLKRKRDRDDVIAFLKSLN